MYRVCDANGNLILSFIDLALGVCECLNASFLHIQNVWNKETRFILSTLNWHLLFVLLSFFRSSTSSQTESKIIPADKSATITNATAPPQKVCSHNFGIHLVRS